MHLTFLGESMCQLYSYMLSELLCCGCVLFFNLIAMTVLELNISRDSNIVLAKN